MLDTNAGRDPVEALAEEFLERKRRGESPTLEEYCQRHPDLAGAIRDLFPALLIMEDFKPDPEASADPLGSPPRAAGVCGRDRVGDYSIVREVGRGGMGVVYEAEQEQLGRRVALKVLSRGARDNKALVRFRREARAAARLHHTNIVPVFEVGQAGDLFFYAMQFIHGEGLDQVIDELRNQRSGSPRGAEPPGEEASRPSEIARAMWTGRFRLDDLQQHRPDGENAEPPPPADPAAAPLPSREISSASLPGGRDLSVAESDRWHFYHSVAQIGHQVAEALAYAHARGIIHRDIKPSNLLLDVAGIVWVTDFGLAKTEEEEGLTGPGDVLGTVRYMSPERFRGECDARADIYGLGLTLYELLTFRPAFACSDRLQLIELVSTTDPAPPRAADGGIPHDLETILLKAIDKDPRRRYQAAEEMAEDLRRFLDDEPIQARRVSAPERLVKWMRRYPAGAALCLLLPVVLLLATAGGGMTWLWRQAETAKGRAELSRREAEGSRNVAQEARHASERARAEAEQSYHRAEQALYINRVMRSHFEWLDNGIARADQLLKECPRSFRDWEWHYMHRLCHSELHTLEGHQDGVRCVAFSPDGTRLVTGSGGGKRSLILWEARTGHPLRTIDKPRAEARGLCFAPDGKRFARVGRLGYVELFDVETGKLALVVSGHQGQTRGVCFSPDGTLLASCGDDGVRVWDARTGKPIHHLVGPGKGESGVSFSPDGKRLASAGPGHLLVVWDAREGKQLFTLDAHQALVWKVCFSPDGRRLASAGEDRLVKVWDADKGAELLTLEGHTDVVTDLSFGPDGNHLASCSYDRTVKVWDVRAGRERLTFRGHTDKILGVSFSPDGKRLASASLDGTVKLWDATRAPQALELGGDRGRIQGICFSPDGQRIAGTSSHGKVTVRDVGGTRPPLVLQGHRNRVPDARFRPDGQRLASINEHGEVKVWDAQTGRNLLTFRAHPSTLGRLCYSPDGRRLATCGRDGAVKVWDAENGEEVLSLKGHRGHVLSLCFSPDGTRLASGSAHPDRTLKVWDARTGQELLNLRGHMDSVLGLCFSPDGTRLASAGADRTVRVWDLPGGQEVFTLEGHRHYVTAVSFSPDGKRLASASRDRTLRVWDAVLGQEVLVLKAHPHWVNDVAFSPDGTRLAAGLGALRGPGLIGVWEAPGYTPKR